MKKVVLILAGGRGERFWPKSRKSLPKQFLSLTDDKKTMIQLTVERVLQFAALEDVYIATNKEYKDLVREQIPNLSEENIFCEPVGRNTAPCIGMAAAYIKKKYGEACMIVLPADHLIKYHKMFAKAIREACDVAEQGENIVTVGITPTYAETGYGYIKFNIDEGIGQAYAVEGFVEKPNIDNAKKYFASEEYLWNSGMFVWKISTILENIKKHIPELYKGLERMQQWIGEPDEKEKIEQEFYEFPSISIDYGILEKADNMYIVPGTFGWDDVGSWLAVSRIKQMNESGNVIDGNIITIDTKNCVIEGNQKLIAAVGVQDLIVVDTEDATLICDKANVSDIKKVIENLKICNRDEYI